MIRLKKVFVVLLVFVIVLQSIACAPKEKSNETENAPKEKSTEQKAEENSNETGIKDVNKKSSLYFEDTLSFTWMISESDIPLSDDILTLNWIRENMNVDIHIMAVPESDYDTKLSTLMATNSLPDVFNSESSIINTAASNEMILNLSDYEEHISDYLSLVENEDRKSNTATYKYNGSIYGFQTLEDYRIGIAPLVVLRTDLLGKYGIKTPTSWEELYDAMLIFKEKDPNNYVFSTRNGISYLLGNIAYSMGAGGYGATRSGYPVYYEPQTDRWTYGPTKEEFKNAVQYLANAYQDGLLHPDYSIMDRTMVTSYLTSGALSVVIDNTTFSNSYNLAIGEVIEGANFDMLDPLTYGNSTEARQITFTKDWDSFTFINSKIERANDIVKFFNWLYTEEGEMITNYGVEGVTYEIKDGEPRLLDSVCEIGDYAAIRAEYGLGTWYIANHVNEKTNMDLLTYQANQTGIIPVNISQSVRIQELKEQGRLTNAISYPNFTNEERERLVALETKLNTIFDQEIDKFITGTRGMDKWQDFVGELASMGVAELEQIYNDAYARLQ